MYREFFGFSEKPFDVTPDPKFLFLSPSHREVLASLIYGIRERRGFISVVGEVGTGKTTLLNTLLDRLDENTKVANIFNTDVNFRQLLLMALVEFDLAQPNEKLTKVEALHRLNEFAIKHMAHGGNVVVVVDEAQNLDRHSMENLRLLSNLETRKQKLIQIILSGQPELEQKLAKPELRQLSQRISLKRYIAPLSERETYDYIDHRLSVAGFRGSHLFDARAKELIWEHSRGIPRKINILCDNIFLIGYGLRKKRIDAAVVKEAIKDLEGPHLEEFAIGAVHDGPPPILSIERRRSRRFALGASLLLAAFCGSAIGILFGYSLQNFKEKGVSQPLALRETMEANSLPGNQIKKKVLPEAEGPKGDGLPKANQDVRGREETKDKEILRDQIISYEETESQVAQQRVNQSPAAHLETQPVKQKAGGVSSEKTIVVRRGDSLSGIIKKIYGRYDENMLTEVLKKNPYIRNPEFIMVGQVLTMPSDSEFR